MAKKLKVEQIEWLDHYGTESPWRESDEVEISECKCISFGIVVGENKDYIVLAGSIAPETNQTNTQNAGRMYVLKRAITKRKILGRI